MSRWTLWCSALLTFLSLGPAIAAEPAPSAEPVAKLAPASPLSPEESQKHFQIDPDCRIELVAAEPDVSAPVSIAFDEKGQLWVVEMHDYPNGPAPGEPGKSRIRVLTDEDGDGKYSNPRVFVDQLLFANSLMHWDGGVLVTTDGKLIYFKDTDNDGKSDLREVWFEGFATENPQLRCNHPTFGPDNWIYVANGLRNGKVRAVRPKWPKPAPEGGKIGEPVDISGRDFRFNPFTGECEAVSGYGQFGLTFDDEGNRYVCSNRNPCMKVIIEERHLKLNPNLAVPSVYEDVSPAGEKSKLYPISRAWTTSNLHAGQFSAACGLIFYRGTALPQKFYNQSFTCDPTGNLVHHDDWDIPIQALELEMDIERLQQDSGTSNKTNQTQEIAEKQVQLDELRIAMKREFLASDETWFRPVNAAMGPDGALYIVDMYRAVIEHPEYMPTELKTRSDLSLGAEKGRIWRIVSKTGEPGGVSPRSASLPSTPDEIAKLVTHRNGWYRDLAHRLMIEQKMTAAEDALRHIVETRGSGVGAAVAMRTLDGLGELKSSDLQGVLQRDILNLSVEHPGNRWLAHPPHQPLRHAAFEACRLAEQFVAHDDALVLKLFEVSQREESINFRDKIHFALGQLGDRFLDERTKMSIRDLSPVRDFRIVLAIAASERPVLTQILTQPLSHFVVKDFLLDATLREATPDQITLILESFLKNDRRTEILRLAEDAKAKGLSIVALVEKSPRIRELWDAAIEDAAKDVKLDKQHEEDLRMSIQFLQFAKPERAIPLLRNLMESSQPSKVMQTATSVVATMPDPEATDLLLTKFSQRTPALRSTIISALLTSEPRITKLLDLVESNQVSFLEIGQTRLASLQQVKNPEIQARLQKLIAANAPADRSKVLEEYQAALAHEHDPLRGRELFAKNCAQCHKVGDLGVDVAPNISDSRVKTHEQLLVDILDPNRAIDNNYFSYTLVDTSGKVSTGIISSETSSSVTMKQPEGKTITVLRSDIEQLKPNGVSLMPVGFEKQLTVAQLADVISFVKNWRYLDGDVPKEVIK